MSDKEQRPYKVGYKRPPKEYQFRKGQPSANPRGRAKKSRNFANLLNKALQESVTIIKNGMKKKMTAQEAIALTMIANAMFDVQLEHYTDEELANIIAALDEASKGAPKEDAPSQPAAIEHEAPPMTHKRSANSRHL